MGPPLRSFAPMRMLHHGSGPWTYRIQGCGAIDPRSNAGSPLIVILLTQPACVRRCSRARRCSRHALGVAAEEATSLDSSCARRLPVGDEETAFQIEQRN